MRLGAPSITHHANAYVQEPGGRARVASYSPGTGGKAYPDGVAKLIPAGTTLILNMHYNPKGQPGHDPGTRVGLKFATGPIRQVAITDDSSNNAIDIPPGEANYELAGKPFVFAEDSHLLTFTPRMNERGKDITYTLVRPDGSRQVLLRVPKFSVRLGLHLRAGRADCGAQGQPARDPGPLRQLGGQPQQPRSNRPRPLRSRDPERLLRVHARRPGSQPVHRRPAPLSTAASGRGAARNIKTRGDGRD